MLLTKMANKEVFDFLRTVTIKNGYFADQFKKLMVNSFYQNLIPTERNPYYIHLAGNYILSSDWKGTVTDPATGSDYDLSYSSKFLLQTREDGPFQLVKNSDVYTSDCLDEMIVITSLDTGKKIPFTREILHGDPTHPDRTAHKKTLEAYKVSTKLYDRLCKKYPNQVDLIKSIVYATPAREITEEETASNITPSAETRRMELLVSAKHLSIVGYDDSVLEESERVVMIDQINAFLDLFRTRWDVPEYLYEENYANVSWAMIWSLLPLALISTRYANIKTPNAHSTHIWNYLMSQGLESYRGYLTSEQEHFLYKNIKFLKENKAQHRILNIMIDKLLKEYSLHVEAKTVLLDTTNTLTTDSNKETYFNQCKSCSRASTCIKSITEYRCEDYLGTTRLYRPEPVVLSEPVPGPSEEKIIKRLMNDYGVDEETAKKRYTRSFMWKDEAIEKIKDELNRVQSIDTDVGEIEDLSDTFEREVKSELEPDGSEGVFKDQKSSLQHIQSTYLPTKLLEITEDPVSPKYSDLFNKFLTDSLLHMCPNKVNGVRVQHITETYKFTVGKEKIQFVMNLGEMIAAAYLGYMRENNLDVLVNNQFQTDVRNSKTYDFPIPTGGRLTMAFKFGKPVKQEDLINAWDNRFNTINQQYFVSLDEKAVDGKIYYIDNGAGTMVVIDRASIEDDEEYEGTIWYESLLDSVTNKATGKETAIVVINDTLYAVTPSTEVWDGLSVSYEILGVFKKMLESVYAYYENNGEIPIVPKFFRWYGYHLGINKDDAASALAEQEDSETEDITTTVSALSVAPREVELPVLKASSTSVVDLLTTSHDVLTNDVPFESSTGATAVEEHQYRDNSKATKFILCEMDKYLDVSYIIKNLYIDAMSTISEQSDIGSYFTKMFDLFYRLDSMRCMSCSAKEQAAIRTFLQACMFRGADTFDLVTIEGNSKPTYADWMEAEQEFGTNIKKIDNDTNRVAMWNEFNTKILNCLLEGCTSIYMLITADESRYSKLKQLVRSLSSYLINFIDKDNSSRIDSEIDHVCTESLKYEMSVLTRMYFDAFGETTNSPRIGAIDGDLYVPTDDTSVQTDTDYYVSYVDSDGFTQYEKVDLSVGTSLVDSAHSSKVYYFKVNLYDILGIATNRVIEITRENRVWKCRVGEVVSEENGASITKTVNASAEDSDTIIEDINKVGIYDFVKDYLGTESPERLEVRLYTKKVPYNKIIWGSYFTNDEVSNVMNLMFSKSRTFTTSKSTFVIGTTSSST